jgi:hypothetical protein
MNNSFFAKIHRIFITGLLLSSSLFAVAQAPLEPANSKVIYGIGQDSIVPGTGTDVTNGQLTQVHEGIEKIFVATGARPMLTHFYVGEYTGSSSGWTFENRLALLNDFNTKQARDYVGLFSFKFQAVGDVDKLLNGTYDTAIKAIGAKAAEANKPMFFRPFYEFNQYGDSYQLWIDYAKAHPEKTKEQWFIAAWKKFRSLILVGGNGGKVAFVWCMLGANATDFQAYYPGDAYVDWVGIDIFSSGHLSNASGPILTWVKTKTNRGDGSPKPIILPEVQPALTPQGQGGAGTQGKQAAVDDFFTPLFNFIENNNNVKALVYMNFWFKKLVTDNPTGYAWVNGAGLANWGDGRVQPTTETTMDTTVFNFFSGKIDNNTIYMYEGDYTLLPSVVLTNTSESSSSSSSAGASSLGNDISSAAVSSSSSSRAASSSSAATGGKKKGGGATDLLQLLALLLFVVVRKASGRRAI